MGMLFLNGGYEAVVLGPGATGKALTGAGVRFGPSPQ